MILSIDGSFMLHRARFIAEKNEDITRAKMVLLFMRSLMTVLDQFTPTKVYVYFDKGRSKHRREILEAYKAQRVKDPDCPIQQTYDASRDWLHEYLPTIGIISVLEEGIEADDFAYLVAATNSPGVHVSDDKDWFVNLFPGWHLFRDKAGELHSYEDFCKLVNNNENPRLVYLATRAMVGDKSDNIYGVRGIGWKTAEQLAPKILNKEDLGNSARARAVNEHMDIVKRNMAVMNPIWILHSDEARGILEEAEEKVSTVRRPMDAWKAFGTELDPERGVLGLWAWWSKYNTLIRGINHAAA